MTLRLSRQQYRQLIAWATEAYPRECCGMVLEGEAGVQLQLAANVASDPAQHFEIDPAALIAAEKAARAGAGAIVGYFHSHPHGLARPSGTDTAMAAADGRIWLIISGDEVTAWQKLSSAGFTAADLVIDG